MSQSRQVERVPEAGKARRRQFRKSLQMHAAGSQPGSENQRVPGRRGQRDWNIKSIRSGWGAPFNRSFALLEEAIATIERTGMPILGLARDRRT